MITYDDELRDLFLKSKINYRNVESILKKLGLIYVIEYSSHLTVFGKIGRIMHQFDNSKQSITKHNIYIASQLESN